ncbi:GNAT family N-acetyltransferase [Haloferax sp. MBLA0076]|uniref:GNAT family N-acetyltransferase n=1 Tax=Haloferax litoreum TaxID=2666140 RepID=A0A6A8GD56_9EURY|nr:MULTISPECIES: GNAT family N-acetyltransferase [Haloferax]KAB1192744.1 GNAT family N-acetyltransferase [Haloferax sp. CBA1148]MRX21224.1 GNAT family N-acetyltransferase [Haloferax litoreum]
MTVRVATEEDIDAIRHVAKASWETDYPEVLTRETIEEGFNDWYAREQIADALFPARSLVLVAERDDVVVGFAHATWSSDESEGYILRLYVHPDYRRQNVGHELLNHTRSELASEGVERINAMVLAENDPGNTFYQQFGFEYVDESQTTIGGTSYRENRYVLE